MDTLIFIDTNIFLDFYRYPQGSAALSILKHIDANHDKIITDAQVEMEFKKNRQKVILESITFLKGPNWETFRVPVILSEAEPAKAILKSKDEIIKQTKRLQKSIEAVLRDPEKHDVVYQSAQRLFRSKSPFNLIREHDLILSIQHLARERFIIGYPPRKPGDTSMGDAVNWEWIIHCAKEANKNVVLVSRDSDYGYRYGGDPILNDWLVQEFRERVGHKNKVFLTNRLTHAFELADVTVNKKEIADENKVIDAWTAAVSSYYSNIITPELLQKSAILANSALVEFVRDALSSKWQNWSVVGPESEANKEDERK